MRCFLIRLWQVKTSSKVNSLTQMEGFYDYK
jgi:hypothetical protein